MTSQGHGAGKWLQYGCFGCIGVLLVALAAVTVLVSLGRSAARSQKITNRSVEESLPAPVIRTGAAASPEAEVAASHSDAPQLAVPDFTGEAETEIRPGRVLVDLAQGGVGLAYMQATGLENSIVIGCRQLVGRELQVPDMLPLGNTQRVQVGLLVTALAIGGNQLDYPNLFALVFGSLGVVLYRGLGTHPHLADLGEAVANDGVGNVLHLDEVRLHPGEFVEIVAPLFGNPIGVLEIGLIEVLHVGGITTSDMGTPPQEFH